MRKKVLLLFPYRFTEFTYYKFEISKLKKKYNLDVIIHDLSNIISNAKLNAIWKTKLEKKTIKFSSLISWISYFNKIKKEKIIISNHIEINNLNSLIINLVIKLSKLPVMLYEQASPFPIFKKNINFFFSRIKEHGFNYKVYLFYIKSYFFRFFDNLIKYEKIYLFSNIFYKKNHDSFNQNEIKRLSKHEIKKNFFFKIDFNAWDYSNALLIKQNKKKKFIKKYIIYIDSGGPYFTGDTQLKGNRLPDNDIKKYYYDLNIFFNKIEKYFKAKVIVIPHQKYKSSNTKKIKSFNPYFNNRIVNNDYDALAKLSPNCLFFIEGQGSLALSYAIIYYKPVIHIYSSKSLYEREEFESISKQAKNFGNKLFDISAVNKKKIMKNLTINKSKYKYYKYKYLTPKNKAVEKIPNYKIIGNFLEKHF